MGDRIPLKPRGAGSNPAGGTSVSSDAPVLILTGPPGVGKTTVAALLASRFPRSVHLEADHFFRCIRAGFVEPWRPESNEQNRAVMGVVADAAAGYAAAGYFTLVEGILIPGWFLEPVRDALRGAGYRVDLAILRAPLPACLARVRQREGIPSIDPAAIEQVWRGFSACGELEANVLDLGEERPDEVAELLVGRLEDGLLAA
jgi:DNA polymerase III delta prime subunit